MAISIKVTVIAVRMFATPLRQPNVLTQSQKNSPGMDGHDKPYQYEITDHGYGKDAVKVLHVSRKGLTTLAFESRGFIRVCLRNHQKAPGGQ